jgi:uncharacterized protein YcfJ
MLRLMIVALVGSFLLLTPDSAAAQTSATSFEDLGRQLSPGERLFVTDTSGTETSGRFAAVTPHALTVTVGRERREFAAGTVRRIERLRRDPVRNGVLIGAGAGALIGLLIGRGTDSPSCPTPGVECGQGAAVGTVAGALWGGLGGWLVDARTRRREVVFEAAGPP